MTEKYEDGQVRQPLKGADVRQFMFADVVKTIKNDITKKVFTGFIISR